MSKVTKINQQKDGVDLTPTPPQNKDNHLYYSYAYNIERTTKQYLDGIDAPTLEKMSPHDLANELYLTTKKLITQHDIFIKAQGENESKWSWPAILRINDYQIAQCMLKKEHIANISQTENAHSNDQNLLGIYETDGREQGTYAIDNNALIAKINDYVSGLDTKAQKEVIANLKANAPIISKTVDPDLIPVNNGIFDYKHQKLLEFDPKYCFLNKSHVNLVKNPENPVIQNQDGTFWNVHDWFDSLSDDAGVPELLWQVTGAVLRSNVNWNQAIFLYSSEGRNGKGTLCDLWRNLLGTGSYMTLPLNQMSNQFALEPLVNVNAIITDENDVGAYLDKAANLKALITGDPVTIDRKFKSTVTYEFSGIIIECLNDVPQIKDKSDSLYRRQLFIPMNKSFKNNENKDIKEKYLKRSDVLEYVMWYVLTQLPKYYKFNQPEATKQALIEYKQENDPVEQFLATIIPECQWDGLPFTFLYDLYSKWYNRNMANTKRLSSTRFARSLKDKYRNGQVLYGFRLPSNEQCQFKTGNRLSKPEPLIATYSLVDWLNPNTTNPETRLQPVNLKEKYTGLVRA